MLFKNNKDSIQIKVVAAVAGVLLSLSVAQSPSQAAQLSDKRIQEIGQSIEKEPSFERKTKLFLLLIEDRQLAKDALGETKWRTALEAQLAAHPEEQKKLRWANLLSLAAAAWQAEQAPQAKEALNRLLTLLPPQETQARYLAQQHLAKIAEIEGDLKAQESHLSKYVLSYAPGAEFYASAGGFPRLVQLAAKTQSGKEHLYYRTWAQVAAARGKAEDRKQVLTAWVNFAASGASNYQPEPFEQLAEVYRSEGDLERLRELLELQAQQEPDDQRRMSVFEAQIALERSAGRPPSLPVVTRLLQLRRAAGLEVRDLLEELAQRSDYSGRAEALRELASLTLKAEDWLPALKTHQDLLALTPKASQEAQLLLNNLIQISDKLGKVELSILYRRQKVLGEAPGDPQNKAAAFGWLMDRLWAAEDHQAAVQLYKDTTSRTWAQASFEGSAQLHYLGARAFEAQGDFAKANLLYGQALEQNQAQGQAAQAIALARKLAALAKAHFPGEPEAQAQERLRDLYAAQGNPSGEAKATLLLAQKRESLGQQKLAVSLYERALKLYRQVGDQNRVDELLTLLANARGGAPEERLARLKELESTQGEDPKSQIVTRVELGHLYSQLKKTDLALAAYQDAFAMNQQDPQLRLQAAERAANLLVQLGQAQAADQLFSQAEELLKEPPQDPKTTDLLVALLRAHANQLNLQGQSERALQRLDLWLNRLSGEARLDLMQAKGAVLLQAQRPQEAAQLLEQASQGLPYEQALRLRGLLAKAQLAQGDYAPALKTIEALLEQQKTPLNEAQVELTSLKSYALNRLGRLNEALANQQALVQSLTTQGPEGPLSSAELQLAGYQLEGGQPGKAQEVLERIKLREGVGAELQAKALLLEAKIAQQRSQPAKAHQAFEALEPLLAGGQFPELSAEAHYQRGFLQLKQQQFAQALESFSQAEKEYFRLGRPQERDQCRLAQANLQAQRGQYKPAREAIDKVLSEAPQASPLRGDALNLRGFLQSEQGQYSEALETSQAAEDFYQAQGQEAQLPEVLNSRGLIYLKMRDLQQAEITLNAAWEAAQKSGNRVLMAEVANNLGGLYRGLGQLEKAQKSLLKASELQRELGLDSQLALTYNNLGALYLEQEDYPQALDFLQRAQQQARSFDLKKEEALAWNNLGILHFRQDQRPAAQKAFEEAIKGQKVLGLDLEQARSLNNLAFLAQASGNLELALERVQEAVALLSFKPLDKKTRFPTPEAASVLAPDLMTGFLLNRGSFLKQLADSKKGKEQRQLQVSGYESFALAIELLETQRSSIKGEESQQMLMQSNIDLYQQLIALLFDLGKNDPGGPYHQKAFYYAEASRARSFLDRLQEQAAKASLTLPADLRQKEEGLRLRQEELNLAIFAELSKEPALRDRKKIEQWQLEKVEVQLAFTKLATAIEKQFPAFASLKYPKIMDVEGVRKNLLDADSRLLSYFLGDDRSFGWSIGKGGFEMLQLPPAGDIDALVRSYRDTLVNPLVDENDDSNELIQDMTQIHLATGLKLYRQLIAPLIEKSEDHKKLLIIPDGVLYYLPFETTLVKIHAPSDTRYPKGREYLLFEHAVRYAPSASVLATIEDQLARRDPAKTKARKDFIGFGDPEYGPEKADEANFKFNPALKAQGFYDLARLFGTRSELNNISEIFADSNQVYLREEAQESRVKSSLQGYKYVHFATHGILDEKNPEFSGVVLNLVQPDGVEDGFLQTSEVFDLKVDADLVVLSACETGLGKVIKGEGMVGLTRSFLFAGSPSIVVSLWSVADDSTAQLMIHFYKNLNQGMGKTEALRQAKITLLRQQDGDYLPYADPFFWGPFILNGG
ncbi:MAG: CHAT domain-containing protein [bacterium]|nr:CHAT domain-containing protein [bacterium]